MFRTAGGARAALALGATVALWFWSAAPQGAAMAIQVGVICALFSTRDDPLAAVKGFIKGALLAAALATLYRLVLLPASDGFPALVLSLAPLYLLAGLAMARPATVATGTALTIFFPLLLDLRPVQDFSAAPLFNNMIGLGLGMGFAVLAFLLLWPGDDAARARRRLCRDLCRTLARWPIRRRRPNSAGSEVDLRATLRATLRAGGATIPLEWRIRRRRPPTLVALCDISGSMSGYTRMLLHFLHALTNDRDRVHTFLFGTRLTNATRHLRHRDGDVALERLQNVVEDWDGGTRIGACIEEFNYTWSRRVLGQGAVVLLITDGLDREGGEGLGTAMDRLHRSCRRLIWLNPLLRYEEFQPEAQGIRAILPHVDEFRAVHSLNSLRELAQVLTAQPTPVRRGAGATIGGSGAEAEAGGALPG